MKTLLLHRARQSIQRLAPHGSTTLYALTTSGFLDSISTTYATARTGGGTLNATVYGEECWVGQVLAGADYYAKEGVIGFDTSVIPVSATVLTATLSGYLSSNSTTTDFTIEVRVRDWGATLTTADFVSGASLGSDTLVASLDTTTFGGGYRSFTNVALPENIVKSGVTRLMLSSSRHRNGDTPTGEERCAFYLNSANQFKLEVVW